MLLEGRPKTGRFPRTTFRQLKRMESKSIKIVDSSEAGGRWTAPYTWAVSKGSNPHRRSGTRGVMRTKPMRPFASAGRRDADGQGWSNSDVRLFIDIVPFMFYRYNDRRESREVRSSPRPMWRRADNAVAAARGPTLVPTVSGRQFLSNARGAVTAQVGPGL